MDGHAVAAQPQREVVVRVLAGSSIIAMHLARLALMAPPSNDRFDKFPTVAHKGMTKLRRTGLLQGLQPQAHLQWAQQNPTGKSDIKWYVVLTDSCTDGAQLITRCSF